MNQYSELDKIAFKNAILGTLGAVENIFEIIPQN